MYRCTISCIVAQLHVEVHSYTWRCIISLQCQPNSQSRRLRTPSQPLPTASSASHLSTPYVPHPIYPANPSAFYTNRFFIPAFLIDDPSFCTNPLFYPFLRPPLFLNIPSSIYPNQAAIHQPAPPALQNYSQPSLSSRWRVFTPHAYPLYTSRVSSLCCLHPPLCTRPFHAPLPLTPLTPSPASR